MEKEYNRHMRRVEGAGFGVAFTPTLKLALEDLLALYSTHSEPLAEYLLPSFNSASIIFDSLLS